MVQCIIRFPQIHCKMDRCFWMKHLKTQCISSKNLTQSLPAALGDPVLPAALIASLSYQISIEDKTVSNHGVRFIISAIVRTKWMILPLTFKLSKTCIHWTLHLLILTQDNKTPAALEGSSAVSGYSEKYLFEEDIFVGKELHTWESAVFSGFVFVILQKRSLIGISAFSNSHTRKTLKSLTEMYRDSLSCNLAQRLKL